MDRRVDGNASLEEQRRTLRYAELIGRYKLKSYEKTEQEKFNKAAFDEAELGEDVPELVMLAVPPAQSIGSLVAAQLALGKNLLFHKDVYVKGEVTKVAAFR